MKVSLFITCYNDTLFPQVGKAVVAVLERLGCEVAFPAGQTCCGQMHWNTGYQEEVIPLLRRFVEQFQNAEEIVIPSSSCVAMMREYYSVLAQRIAEESGDTELQQKVMTIIPRVWEFSEFLVKRLGLTNVGARFPHRVAYHASCHGLRMLDLKDGPESLLRSVDAMELVEIPSADRCCGFGGTFAVKNADVSSAMLEEKLDALLTTGAEVCTACDTSCLLHIAGGLHRRRAAVKTVHLAEILSTEPERC